MNMGKRQDRDRVSWAATFAIGTITSVVEPRQDCVLRLPSRSDLLKGASLLPPVGPAKGQAMRGISAVEPVTRSSEFRQSPESVVTQ